MSRLAEELGKKCGDYPKSIEHLELVLEAIKDYGHTVKPSFGTLLGLHRDGKLIPHDSDIDINIYKYRGEVVDKESLLELMKTMGYELLLNHSYQVVFCHPESVIIDICFFTQQENGSYLCKHQVKFFTLTAEAVENDESFLEQIYGDWQTPKDKNKEYLI